MTRVFRVALLVLWLIASLVFIGYAWIMFRIGDGRLALRQGDSERARATYSSTEEAIKKIPPLVKIMGQDFQRLVFDQVAILYANGSDHSASEKLQNLSETLPSAAESAEFSFWSGNLHFRRGLQSKKAEERTDELKTAAAEYQKGLEAEPDSWDLKYNYELAKSALMARGSQKQSEEKTKSILEKSRPAEPSGKELAPEKRG